MAISTTIDRIAQTALDRPQAIAVRHGDATLSYMELDLRANRLAHHLRQKGVTVETTVGVCAERSLELVVMLLAIWKAGGAYVALDPDYPVKRLQWIAQDAGCILILTQQGSDFSRLGSDVPLLEIAPEADGLEAFASYAPVHKASAANLAYILYTSGSTGQPKGVMVEHGALLNHMFWMTRRFPLAADDHVLQKTPFGFDASIWEFWAPLAEGAVLVLARPGGHRDTTYLAQILDRERITVLQMVPSMLQALLDEDAFRTNRHLKRVFCGGEALSSDLVADFHKSLPVQLINLYGPTETTIDASFWVCGAERSGGMAPIGRPIDNTTLHVLDEALRPMPAGEVGELFIAGSGLARGYRNLPEQTAARFLQAPGSGMRMYRTGDRVRAREDGALEFIGRFDDQIKLRGNRIELSEIEIILSQQEGVRQAVALVHEQRLVAFISAEADDVDLDRLRRSIATRLPDYMLPEEIRVLQRFPLNMNGKLDRQVLRNIVRQPNVSWIQPRAANTAIETRLVAFCSELLGLNEVGIDQDFFRIGGNSLLATRLAARIRRELVRELPLAVIFQRPTIAMLAEWIESQTATAVALVIPEIEGPAPVSFAQERVWFIEQLAPDNLAYTFRTVTRLNGPLDQAALETSLSEIVRRHEIFRTSFHDLGGRPVQHVHPEWTVRLPLHDLSEEGEAAAERLIDATFRQGFDLGQLPLIRWTLIRLAPEQHLLAQVEHHLVHDGWSFNIYLRELRDLYAAFVAGRPSPLPPLTLQFRHYAAWERARMQQDGLAEAQLCHWRQALAGAPRLLELRQARPRLAEQHFRGGLHRVEVPAATARKVRAVCREEGATLFMGMLAAFKMLLHVHSGALDIVVGSGVANRQCVEFEPVMGMMLNTVALRTDLQGDPTFRECVARVRRTTLDAYANQEVPFERVVDALGLERDLRYNPIAQIMFSFHDAPLPDMDVGPLKIDVTDLMENGSAKFDLSLIVIPRLERSTGTGTRTADESIVALWEFNSDLYDAATVESLSRDYLRLLAELSMVPQRPLSALSAPDTQQFCFKRDRDTTPPLLEAALEAVLARHGSLRAPGPDGALLRASVAGEPGRHRVTIEFDRLAREFVSPEETAGLLLTGLDALEAGEAADRMPPAPASRGTDHATPRAAAQRYWRSRAPSWPEPWTLNADHASTTVPLPGQQALQLDHGLAMAASDLACSQGGDLHRLLLGLLALLLHRHGAGREVALGSIEGGAGVQPAGGQGPAVLRVLPVAVALDPEAPIGPLLRQLRAALEAAAAHPATSADELDGVLAAAGRAPAAFAATLCLEQPTDRSAASWTPVQVPLVGGQCGSILDWRATLSPDGLLVRVGYDASRFDALRMRRLLDGFGALLRAVTADPYLPLGLATILGDEEKSLVCACWNDTQQPIDSAISVAELFRRQVGRAPDAIALICGEERVSYRDLDRRAEALARRLVEAGIGPGQMVPMHCRRSVGMVVGMLAIIKAGAAYVPLDVAYPRERIAYILREIDATLILSETDLAAQIEGLGVEPVSLDAPVFPTGSQYGPVEDRAGPHDLAYVIYTSGTTGHPKGVMVGHRNLSNFIQWFVQEYELGPGKLSIVHSPLVFDLTVSTLWGALVSGGTAHLLEDGDAEQMVAAFGRIRDAHLVKLTPAHLDLLRSGLPEERLATLAATLIVAGDVFPASAARQWQAIAPRTRLVNFYGPTEITVGCTVQDVGQAMMPGFGVPIGRPIANVRVHVLDSRLQPLPIGVAGEIFIGGAGVTHGYLKQPELSQARFICDPFDPGQRLYRSGDIGRWLPDGSIDYLARSDGQVKLRGFRIELGEIECVLAAHPDVAEAAVIVERSGSEPALVAWMVPHAGRSIAASAIRTHAQASLPPYMVPVVFGEIVALPLNVNGKLDRAALSARGLPTAPAASLALPATATEHTVLAIWRTLLGRSELGVEQDFFTLGGNSLMAVRMVGRIREAQAVTLPLRAVFDHSTIRSLCRHIDNLQWSITNPRTAVAAQPREEFQL